MDDLVDQLGARPEGLEHLEHVPTQIVTQYLPRVFSPSHPVDGLIFTSAVDGGGGTCTVLDVPRA